MVLNLTFQLSLSAIHSPDCYFSAVASLFKLGWRPDLSFLLWNYLVEANLLHSRLLCFHSVTSLLTSPLLTSSFCILQPWNGPVGSLQRPLGPQKTQNVQQKQSRSRPEHAWGPPIDLTLRLIQKLDCHLTNTHLGTKRQYVHSNMSTELEYLQLL